MKGFSEVQRTLYQETVLQGHSTSIHENYLRSVVEVCLNFNRLPELISDQEIKDYLMEQATKSKTPSRSGFLHTVYGLQYYYRHIGQKQQVIDLPVIKKKHHLPVILNQRELRELFHAPEVLKHRVLLTLIYSAFGSGEIQNMKSYQNFNLLK